MLRELREERVDEALAEILGCEFWTADERLVNAAKDKLPWNRWLGDYELVAGQG